MIQVCFVLIALSNPGELRGATLTWNSSPTDNNWVASSPENNWNSGTGKFPGSVTGIANADVANFLTSNVVSIAINSSTLNIGSIQFGSTTVAPNSFTVGSAGGSSLFLSSGGKISMTSGFSSVSNLTQQVLAPLVLEPSSPTAGGSYSFVNNAGGGSNVIQIRGSVAGGATTQGVSLSLDGTNTGSTSLTGGNIVIGVISDGGALGGLSLTKSGNGVWTLSGSNTFTGGTTLDGANAGTLRLLGAGTLGADSGKLTVNQGTLDLNSDSVNTSRTVGALSGTGGTITNNSSVSNIATFNVGMGNGSGSYAGSIVDHVGSGGYIILNKVGTGTETLIGASSYSKGTTISAGTLQLARISGSALTGTGRITISNGGTLLMGGNNQIITTAPITLGSAAGSGVAKLDAGGHNQGTGGIPATPNSGTIGIGALTLAASSVLDLTGTSVVHFAASGLNTWTGTLSIYDWNGIPATGGGSEQVLFGGTSSGLTAAQLAEIQFYSGAGTGAYAAGAVILADGEIVPLTAVPEPSTWVAAFLSAAGLAWNRRNRSSRQRRKAPPLP